MTTSQNKSKRTLRQEIRDQVDQADEMLPARVIYAGCASKPNRNVFSVTLNYMVDDRQLRKRKACKSMRSRQIPLVYGPGPKPVNQERFGVDRGRRIMGFMEEKRMREAKAAAKAKHHHGVSRG